MNTLILLAALAPGQPPAAVPLHCPMPTAAKGEVKGGPPLTHTFELTHRGPAGVTITITKVEAGCGCLRRTLNNGLLKTGDTAQLTLEVNTLTQPDGPNRWQVAVSYTVDHPGAPVSGELLLVVTANLSRDVSLTPPQVGFSCTGEATQVLTVADRRAKPLTITRAATTSPHLTAAVAAVLAPPGGERTQAITVKLAADAPAGHRDETVVLYTDDPAYPEFRVPVRVLKRVAGAVAANPESVAVRLVPGQDEVSSLVQLRAPDGKMLAVQSAESDHPAVTVKASAGAGPVATLRVTVGAAAAGQSGSATVRVRLTEPAGQEVTVPVSWTGGVKK